jgi:CBS domain-containing protein
MLSNKITEIMTTQLLTAPASSTVYEVIKIMIAEDAGRIVLTENDVPVGMFTERHVLRRIAKERLDLKNTSVDDVMSSPIHAVAEETPIVDALGEMFRGRIRHLLVRGRRGKIGGIVSMRRVLMLAVELGHGLSESTSVGSIMSDSALVVDESSPVATVVDRMTKTESSAAVILAGKIPFGIFTERDVLRRVVGMGLDMDHTLVKEVMTTPLFKMAEGSMVGAVMGEMYRRDIRNMPIVGAHGEFTGIVSMPEVLQYARAFDIDESVRRSWKELQREYESGDDYTPG